VLTIERLKWTFSCRSTKPRRRQSNRTVDRTTALKRADLACVETIDLIASRSRLCLKVSRDKSRSPRM
jgi:hypothetical protein